MDSWSLRQMLAAGPVVADGAMGTSLLAAGVPAGTCFDELNISDPERVAAVHASFAAAGATFVSTNTFGANRFRLSAFGQEHRVEELNRAGVEVARTANALVAGSVGPLGVRLAPYGRVSTVDAFDAFEEQISELVAAGVDFLLIETQTDLAEVRQATAAAQHFGVGIMVSMAFSRDDRTMLGQTPEQVAQELRDLDVDVIGVNCSEGPAQILRIVRAMRPLVGETAMLARPNAGSPQQVGGRYLYPATPEYVAEYSRALLAEGVKVVGGCCGTGPTHIQAIADVVHEASDTPSQPIAPAEPSTRVDIAPAPAAGAAQRSALATKLSDGSFVIAVEMDPPRSFSAARMIAAAQTMAEAGADVIDVADAPMARMRMSAWAACRLIEEEVGIETVLHFPTRGRNLLRLQGDLLAVHALGLRNLFVCMGDPVSIGDYPGSTDNVDVVPTGFMRLVTESFNQGVDRSGASIGEATRFVVGCAVSPNAADPAAEVALLRKKINAGAVFGLSQPIFDHAPLLRLRSAYEDAFDEPLELPICVGVLPLVSERHATFLHNEVPGISIPSGIRERLAAAGADAEREGVAMASELVSQLRTRAAGVYLMPPFERFDLAAEIVEAARSV